MGHRHIVDVKHVLFVDTVDFNRNIAYEAAREIAKLNEAFVDAGESYVLLSPGRLGTRNAALGVPLTFPQVGGAAALVELSTLEFAVEPSQGTHFFHNMVSRGMPFLSVETGRGDLLNRDWIEAQPKDAHGPVWHLRPQPALEILVLGTKQEGMVFQPLGEE
jgi:hypothetical protein